MKLTDHYLIEDNDMRDEHLSEIIKIKAHIFNCALEGNFIHMQQMQDKLSVSLKILEALSNKKISREQMNVSETIRRSYF